MSKTKFSTRFLSDKSGVYDLSAVHAITPSESGLAAVLHFAGGQVIPTYTALVDALDAWATALDEAKIPPPPAELPPGQPIDKPAQ